MSPRDRPDAAQPSSDDDASRREHGGLRLLVVDDERPALDELAFLLGRDDRVGSVVTCSSGGAALGLLAQNPVDGIFLDVAMPDLSGLELASALRHLPAPPVVVFVTAHTEHAVEAFELRAVDYLLKPVRVERLREAVRRVEMGAHSSPEDETIPVELGGVVRFVPRSEVRYVEAQGDYSRLHTPGSSHLVRVPLTSLEGRWADAGFVRIHRSLLVALAHVDEIRNHADRCEVVVDGSVLQASRRHTPALRELLRSFREGAQS